MLKKRVKVNSVSKKLRILDYNESQDVFGSQFLNDELESYYKTMASKSELRGIRFEPQMKEFAVNQETLKILENQLKQFSTLFYLFLDIYNIIFQQMQPQPFSTPRFIEDLNCPNEEYCLVFNDSQSEYSQMNYQLNNYSNFLNFYQYPQKILKISDSIMRSPIAQAIDIEILKANGFIRNGDKEGVFERLLEAQLDGRLDNYYFYIVAGAYHDYMSVKRAVEAENYALSRYSLYESEYFILKNIRFSGSIFGREDFTMNRIFISKSGIFVASFINYGKKGETLQISADDTWSLLNQDNEVIHNIESPIPETSLDCIAIKQILRQKYGEKIDNVPIVPLVIVCNDDVNVLNLSQYYIVKGNELYTIIDKKPVLDFKEVDKFGNDIYSYNIPEQKNAYPIYSLELDSAITVFEDLYYNHFTYSFPHYMDMLWKMKREDYYESQISKRNWRIIFSFVASVVLFISAFFTQRIQTDVSGQILSGVMLFSAYTFIHFIKYEYDYKKAWTHGHKTGDCLKLETSPLTFNSVVISLILTLIPIVLYHVLYLKSFV